MLASVLTGRRRSINPSRCPVSILFVRAETETGEWREFAPDDKMVINCLFGFAGSREACSPISRVLRRRKNRIQRKDSKRSNYLSLSKRHSDDFVPRAPWWSRNYRASATTSVPFFSPTNFSIRTSPKCSSSYINFRYTSPQLFCGTTISSNISLKARVT